VYAHFADKVSDLPDAPRFHSGSFKNKA